MAPRGRQDGGRRVVAIGGGTGLPVILTALKRYLGGRVAALTAVVTVTDDGGSSGRLRDELRVLPPGDIRNCLVALAEVEPLMAELFQFRFPGDGQLAGHSFGNLFLAALTHVTGNFLHAIRISGKVLAVRGTSCRRRSTPCGSAPSWPTGAASWGSRVSRGRALPSDASSSSRAMSGRCRRCSRPSPMPTSWCWHRSLYTSVIPNLLVGGVADALRAAPALKICVANLMTEPGETDLMSLADHVDTVYAHGGRA